MKEVFILLVIIILFVLGIAIGYKATNMQSNNNAEVSVNENTITVLNENNNEIQDEESEEKLSIKENQFKINGTYELDYEEGYVGIRAIYTFDNGEVTCYSDGTRIGTYTIEGDKIYIKFDKAVSPDGIKTTDSFLKEGFFTIKNNDILISPEGEEFIKK